MTRFAAVTVLLTCAVAPRPALAASPTQSESPAKAAVTKPLKTIIGAIRQSRDLTALKHFASDEQGAFLLGDDWKKGSDAQRKEFTSLFQQLFGKIAFPKIREHFQHLDAVLYEEPTVEGERGSVDSVVLINHPVKKQELKLQYTLAKHPSGWRVVDVKVLGDSMLLGIRDDQVRPLFQEGGWDKVLAQMRAKDKELGGVVLK